MFFHIRLFERNIADDECAFAVAFFEVESFGNGFEGFEGEGEVAIVYFTYVFFLGSKGIYFGIVVNVELDGVG
jgi:hypothetical protein